MEIPTYWRAQPTPIVKIGTIYALMKRADTVDRIPMAGCATAMCQVLQMNVPLMQIAAATSACPMEHVQMVEVREQYANHMKVLVRGHVLLAVNVFHS